MFNTFQNLKKKKNLLEHDNFLFVFIFQYNNMKCVALNVKLKKLFKYYPADTFSLIYFKYFLSACICICNYIQFLKFFLQD